MESGRMRRCEQWHLHCTSQWGQWRPLSEHVYLVATAFKMTEQVEQWICSRFCVKLEHSSAKLCGWFRGPQLCTTGDLHLHHDNTATHASRLMQSILAKHQITQVTQHPYSPDLAPCGFWLFPKLKSPLKGERFQTVDEIQENMMGAADGNWENHKRSQGTHFEGDWGVIVLCTVFLVSSSINVSIFHVTWLDTFWTDLIQENALWTIYLHILINP